MVWYETEIVQALHRYRACVIPAGDPFLDAGPVVGLACAKNHRVSHQVQRDWASKMEGDLDRKFQRRDHMARLLLNHSLVSIAERFQSVAETHGRLNRKALLKPPINKGQEKTRREKGGRTHLRNP
eukprot:TRINITY_DN6185_c0_g1_i1.p2 TRINITY_DN6185_c0_g1~~TRINITY_DN6185_c0_g1_i1.p2  ORF type:complete len:126 (-),score=13.50 TRINITY_DN6185_c0_g1_i1:35-412(-)